MTMQTILYARVSTKDQTAAHQRTQAEKAGFTIDRVIEDHGVSGVSVPFADREGGARVLDILRPGDVLVVRWVDRLGRNYKDTTATIRNLMDRGITVRTVIGNFTFDGAVADPMMQAIRDTLIAFLAAQGQAQAEATAEARDAGIAYAKATKGDQAYRGRKPSYDRSQLDQIVAMLATGAGATDISRETGVSRQTVLRVKADQPAAYAALDRWEAA
jgi:DNA invertase Pin-like site-specific DNA recombinase